MFRLDLPFDIQGICQMIDGKLIIGDCPPFKNVEFNGHGCYMRETKSDTYLRGRALECDIHQYSINKEYVFVYFDFIKKYTPESVLATVLSQLNQRLILIKSSNTDFKTIKKEEGLKELKDCCLVKITFESIEEFINDCDGLVCPC